MFKQFTNLKKVSYLSFSIMFTFTSGISSAGNLTISDFPLFLGGDVDPNVMFTLDDSGSMHWENMPSNDRDHIYVYPHGSRGVYRGSGGDTGDYEDRSPQFDAPGNGPAEFIWSVRARSSAVNKLYYNQERRYIPWPGTDREGSLMVNAIPTCALHNGYEPDADNDGRQRETPGDTSGVSDDCRDLTRNNREYTNWTEADNDRDDDTLTFYPAVYYRLTDGGDDTDINDYEKVEIHLDGSTYPPTGTKHVNRTDCVADDYCTDVEEMQNFANWYTYYRSRILTARAGVGRAFAQQANNMRVGFASINTGSNSNFDGQNSPGAMIRGVRRFEIGGDDRRGWFDTLYGHRMPRQGTPLRTALRDVGEYYTRTDNNGPWSESPGQNSSNPHLTCRQSYNVLMTDGFWNGGTPDVGNSDNTAGDSNVTNHIPEPDEIIANTYTPGAPYSDAYSNTLADVAMEYWKTDLRPLLDNEVPRPQGGQDEAFWQHMVTFTVGLGVEPTNKVVADAALALDPPGDPGWPQPGANDIENIDDMWHAAVNSRGEFFSASDPDTFATSLAAILNKIRERTSSASSVALNSGVLFDGSALYQARFETSYWTGQLVAKQIIIGSDNDGDGIPDDSDGDGIPDDFVVTLNELWDAREEIPAAESRKIVTFDGTDGQPFRWNDLTDTQETALTSEDVLNYIRGDQSNEQPGGVFRSRTVSVQEDTDGDGDLEDVIVTRLLGDIINSGPFYVGAPSSTYPINWGTGANENGSPYSEFRDDNADRAGVIYVGANDGMLHGFDAATGAEVLGYVPNAVMKKLKNLTLPNYTHEYFVDGSPFSRDVFLPGLGWRTVLISGLGAGGQGIVALDVTEAPSTSDTESTIANKVLWEFGDTTSGYSDGDADLGYTFGTPSLVRLHNGQWAALFGNGYNNTVDDGNYSGTGDASLFIVNAQTGVQITDNISTETGTAEDPLLVSPDTDGRPNGLSNLTPVDVDGDSITDYVYAGDLFGNLWKFDLTSSSPSEWGVAYEDTDGNPLPLFRARSSDGKPQPITSRVTVIKHPEGLGGYMIYFGTGKYFEPGDNERTAQVTQTMYGIWDRNSEDLLEFNKVDLLKQEIIAEVLNTVNNVTTQYRLNTNEDILYHNNEALLSLDPDDDNPNAIGTTPTTKGTDGDTHLGWYIDLVNIQGGNTANFGEKIVSNPAVRLGRVVINTLIPSRDACDFGGTGWKMELNVVNGGPRTETPFDINDDDEFNQLTDYIAYDADGDGVDEKYIVTGKKSKVGIIPTPTFLSDFKSDREFQFDSGSTPDNDEDNEDTIGNIEIVNQLMGLAGRRQSWTELFR